MKKYDGYIKELINNTIILGIGSALSKILLFLVVPILTRELSTEEYGTIELITSSVNLLLPVFSLIIFEAVLRFTMDKTADKKQVLSVGIQITFAGFAVLCLISIPALCTGILIPEAYRQYIVIFLLVYLCSAVKDILVYFARGENRFSAIAVIGVIECSLLLFLILFFVCYLKLSILGYFFGIIISSLTAIILYAVFLHINLISVFFKGKRRLRNRMVKYSAPMVFNSLGWWFNNTADRYMLSFSAGVGITGIYSVAFKIPSFLNTIVDIFMQAWKVSAVNEYEKGSAEHFSHIYQIFFRMNIIICTVLICFSEWMAGFLFGRDYHTAWLYSMILVMAFLFNGLSGYLGTVFTTVMKTKYLGISTTIGAGINVILNFLLIPNMGAYGAATATLISNFFIFLIRYMYSKKFISIKINFFQQITSLIGMILLVAYIYYSHVTGNFEWVKWGIGAVLISMNLLHFKRMKNQKRTSA